MNKINVLTYATNYDYYVYERFVGTLRNSGFQGILFIIISPKDVTHLVRLQALYKNVNYLIDTIPIEHDINVHRFFVFKKVLMQIASQSTYIFLCDARDVLFQKNLELFNLDPTVDLYGFLEGKKIVDETYCNTPWLKDLERVMKTSFYDAIKDKYVICCGTTLAKSASMLVYVKQMCDIVQKFNIQTNLDQAIHNYMLHFNTLKNVRIKLLSNIDNLVNTVGMDVHRMNNADNVVNEMGFISYVVHQYDRFSQPVLNRLSKKHGFRFS